MSGEMNVVCVIDFLMTEFAQALAAQNKLSFDEQVAQLKQSDVLMQFRQFAWDYLNQHRPTALSHAEANFLVQLMNGKKFAVAPSSANIRGTMQPSTYIPVTGAETMREILANAQGMRGEMTPLAQQQSLGGGSPAVAFDRPGLFQRSDGR